MYIWTITLLLALKCCLFRYAFIIYFNNHIITFHKSHLDLIWLRILFLLFLFEWIFIFILKFLWFYYWKNGTFISKNFDQMVYMCDSRFKEKRLRFGLKISLFYFSFLSITYLITNPSPVWQKLPKLYIFIIPFSSSLSNQSSPITVHFNSKRLIFVWRYSKIW